MPTIAPRMGGPKVHDLKCAAGYFEAVELGHKTAELRVNDRDFAPHDIVRLHELDLGRLTGRALERRITHIVWDSNGPWLAPGYCMLSLGPVDESGRIHSATQAARGDERELCARLVRNFIESEMLTGPSAALVERIARAVEIPF